MGCGASSSVGAPPSEANQKAADRLPVSEDILPSVSQQPEGRGRASPGPTPTRTAVCFGEQSKDDCSPQCSERPSALDTVNTFGEGAAEPDSPIIKSTHVRKKKDELSDESVPTIICEEEEEEAAEEQAAVQHADAVQRQQPAAKEAAPDDSEEEDTGGTQRRPQPDVLPAQQVDTPIRCSPGPAPDTSTNTQGWPGNKPVLASSFPMSESQEFERLAPSGLFLGRDQQNAPGGAETRKPAGSIFPSLPGPAKAKPTPANRYDDITLSDDDDDDTAHGFDLDRWLRFYKWNRNKPADILEFLWRRFDPKHYSIYCATVKAQDNIFAGYQGENLVHGLCCRMEMLRVEVFGILHTLYNCSTGSYKVVGMFIFKGDEVPREFARMPDYEQLQMLKADTKDPAVRKFVGNLVTRCAPAPDLSVVCSQEFPWPDRGNR